MPHIEQLSPHIADLIAAGEVVERPASVAKELLENAIDAGASIVTLELQNGGMTYLRVTDDGCGIAPEELPVAFLRHATSKLRTADELSSIGTLGFRGEALAAISSVSRLDIFSRPRGAAEGASLHLEGGAPGEVTGAGCPEGTSVIVRDLFFNTPARLKFMKQDRAEASAIAGLAAHIALSHPDISFRLIRDGREELHTPGDGRLLSAVYAALGREFALSLTEVNGSDEALSASGFVTRPLAGRGTRGMQTFFVNGRFIKSQLLTAAVEEAYANRIMKGKFPGCVLNVTLPCDMVDVNVHPAKTVVKFVNEKRVFDLVYHAASDALDRDGAPEPPKRPEPKPQGFYRSMTAEEFRARSGEQPPSVPKAANAVISVSPAASELKGRAELNDFTRRSEVLPAFVQAAFTAKRSAPDEPSAAPVPLEAPPPPVEARPAPDVPPIAPAEPEQTTLEPEAPAPWRIAGEVLDTYIVCEDGEKNVWLIDKHAAHERINFDRLKANPAEIMPQELLTPAVVQPGAEEYAALVGQLPLLREFGFICEEFGDGALLIRALPSDIAAGDAVASLEELGGRLTGMRRADPAAARDALLHTIACKSAIKGGWKSDERELRVLVNSVQSGEVRFCPHGRPVAVRLTEYELEKMFKRA